MVYMELYFHDDIANIFYGLVTMVTVLFVEFI